MAETAAIVNFLKAYDRTVYDWVASLSLADGAFIPCRYSPSHKAFSDMAQAVGKNLDQVVLPFASFWRPSDPIFAGIRARKGYYRDLLLSDDKRTVKTARAPFPYDIPYIVDFWFSTPGDAGEIVTQILAQFGDDQFFYPEVDFGDFWGKTSAWFKVNRIEDQSVREPGTSGEAWTRKILDLTCEGWLPLAPKDVKTALAVTVETVDQGTQDVLYADKVVLYP